MDEERYTRSELYTLWKNFKDDDDAERILSDFMICDSETAAKLILEFELKYESNLLGYYKRRA